MKIRKRYLLELITIIICIFLAYFYLLYSSDIIKTLRYKCTDFLFKASSHLIHPPMPKDKLTLISIDEKSLMELGITLPLKKNFISMIIKKLQRYDPQLIFLNFLLVKEEAADKYSDLTFAAAIKRAQNIALPIYYDIEGNRIGPLNIFENVSYKVGFINKIRDWDSTIRRCMLFHLSKYGRLDEYALELAIAGESKGIVENDVIFRKIIPEKISGYGELYRNGFYRIPVQEDGSIYINYLVRPEHLRTISLTDFIRGRTKGTYLKDKIVIVADITETAGSMFSTPLGIMPGIYIFANELIMLLSEKYLRPLNNTLKMFFAFLFMISIGLITFRYNISKSFSILFLSGLLILLFSFFIFNNGILLDYFSLIFPAIGTFIVTGFFRFLVLLEEKIEELKETNIRLQETQQELIKKEQLSTIGKMSAKILHEIKGPLANIKSSFDIIKSAIKEEPKIKRVVQLAGDEISRMFDLSQQLRETYTPHSEDLQAVDINSLLKDSLDISHKRFMDKGVDIKIGLASDIPMINASPVKIKQVFINILNNAFEAVGPGGKLGVYSKIEGKETVSIVFNNNGPEIPQEVLPRIFNAFFTTKKDMQGSGLGLFICKEIIKAHNGDITVKSSREEGTTFTISLPIST